MSKKILLLTFFVIVLGAAAVFLYMMPKKGAVVLSADSEFLPFTVKIAATGATLEPVATCEDTECVIELDASYIDLYMEKDGYYAQNEYFELGNGEVKNITVTLEHMDGVAIDATTVDQRIFDNCYEDATACGEDFYIKKDADTGYMALWEGAERRATFTQGMSNVKIFTGGAENGVVVYDEDSGDAYFVDFVTDSRGFAFNIDKNSDLTGIQATGNGEYLLKIGDDVFWENGTEEMKVVSGLELSKFTYSDGYIYFMADSESVRGYIGDISASGVCVFKFISGNYEVVLNDVAFLFDGAAMGSDESGVYGKSGDVAWRVE